SSSAFRSPSIRVRRESTPNPRRVTRYSGPPAGGTARRGARHPLRAEGAALSKDIWYRGVIPGIHILALSPHQEQSVPIAAPPPPTQEAVGTILACRQGFRRRHVPSDRATERPRLAPH